MCLEDCKIYLPEDLTTVNIRLLPEIETSEFLELFNYSEDDSIFEAMCLRDDFSEDVLCEVSRQSLLQATSSNGDFRSQKKIIDKPVKYLALANGFIRLQYECRGNPSLQYRHGEDYHWGYVDFKGDEISEVFCSCRDFFYRIYYHMSKRYKLSKWRLTGRYKSKMLKSVGNTYNVKRRHDAPVHYRPEGPYKWTNAEGDLFVCKHLYDALNRFIGPTANVPPLLGKKTIQTHVQWYNDKKKQAKELEKQLKNNKVASVEPDIVKQVTVPVAPEPNKPVPKTTPATPSSPTATKKPIPVASTTLKPIPTSQQASSQASQQVSQQNKDKEDEKK